MSKEGGRRDSQRGNGLVEFALVMPLVALIIVAIFDFGRGVYAYNAVANAAREGARYGVAAPTDDSGIIAKTRQMALGLDLADLTVTVTRPTADTIRVYVQYVFHLITPLMTEVLSGSNTITLESTATMYTGY